MVNTPSWVSLDGQLGWPAPGTVDSGITRGDTAYPSVPIGTLGRFRDNGSTALGMGTFIFLPGVSSTTAGDFVSYTLADGAGTGASDGATTTRWGGTANSGRPLAVATAAVDATTKWGWYQLQGAAICNVSGTVTLGDKAFYADTARVQSTQVVSKQVLGIQASSANAVPAAGQAIYTLAFPVVQSQIT